MGPAEYQASLSHQCHLLIVAVYILQLLIMPHTVSAPACNLTSVQRVLPSRAQSKACLTPPNGMHLKV